LVQQKPQDRLVFVSPGSGVEYAIAFDLRGLGFDVTHLTDVAEGDVVKQVVATSATHLLVVLDKHSRKLIKAVRQRVRSLAIAGLATEGALEHGLEAVREGARGFLIQPADAATIAELLRSEPTESPIDLWRQLFLEIASVGLDLAPDRLGICRRTVRRRLYYVQGGPKPKQRRPRRRRPGLTLQALMAAAGISGRKTYYKWANIGLLPRPLRRVSHGNSAGVSSEWPADAMVVCQWFRLMRDRGVHPRAMLELRELKPANKRTKYRAVRSRKSNTVGET
jgi:ActR/RegA family two-component response regulator